MKGGEVPHARLVVNRPACMRMSRRAKEVVREDWRGDGIRQADQCIWNQRRDPPMQKDGLGVQGWGTATISIPASAPPAKGFALERKEGDMAFGVVPQTTHIYSERSSCSTDGKTTSVEGFVQQLAVAYVQHGYRFYVTGQIPEDKDPEQVDRKLPRPVRHCHLEVGQGAAQAAGPGERSLPAT